MTEIPQTAFFILAGVTALALIWLAAEVLDLKKKTGKILGPGDGKNSDLQEDILRRIVRAEARMDSAEPRLDVLESIGKISVQKVGFLRFNPFKDTGGDQSFILVMLDRENNGVVLSSLYMRDGMRLYAKEIAGGESKHPMSEEEKRVLKETVQKS